MEITTRILYNIMSSTTSMSTSFKTFPPEGNYGPLTTVFTPSASCTRVANQTNVPVYLYPVFGGRPDCYPGGRLYQLHYGVMLIESAYYSPGLYCPHGYTTAASWDPMFASAFNERPKLDPSEEAYYCCPSYVLSIRSGRCRR